MKIVVAAALMVVLRFESGHAQKVLIRLPKTCIKTHLKVNVILFNFYISEALKT